MSQTSVFPIRRLLYHANPSAKEYYAYGNTLPEDFLESCSVPKPSILSLGCGDIRSCFYTLWRHFDNTILPTPRQYEGVSFTLLDNCPAILARNVIFIYLAMKLPKESSSRESWLRAMWAIWYCHELSDAHAALLMGSLKYLLKYSSSLELWNSDDNILKPLVHFDSASSLLSIAEVWKDWLNMDTRGRCIEMMRKSRAQLLKKEINSMDDFSLNLARVATFVYGKEESPHLRKMQAEVNSYISSGNCYAESVLGLNAPQLTSINQTLYEDSKRPYALHYGCIPYRAYQQSFELSSSNIDSGSLNPSDTLVFSRHFRNKPFLANSVQQFILWVQSVSRTLNDHSEDIEFILSIQDALVFCHEAFKHSCGIVKTDRKMYSAIYTSNLIDHVGLPNLVLSCVPLLNKDGILFTTSMTVKNCCATIEELLKKCFGFDSSLFPVILGIRCINHEGAKCSSLVQARPVPPDIANQEPNLPNVRKFLWEKLDNGHLLKLSALSREKPGNIITDALVNMIASCAYATLNQSPGIVISIFNTIETAVLMLKFFIANLEEDNLSTPKFWDPLCSKLKAVAHPYLLSLQTHFFLHKIHVHLTVTNEECPLCSQVPVEDVIGLFTLSVSTALLQSDRNKHIFYVFFYKDSSPVSINDLLRLFLAGEDVHLFDSFDFTLTEEKLQLGFFVPLCLVHKSCKYKIALCAFHQHGSDMIEIQSHELSSRKFHFFKPKLVLLPNLSAKANVPIALESHSCNGDETRTVLSCTSTGNTDVIHVERLSPLQIQIMHGSSTALTVNFNYPTCQENLVIKDTTATVTSQRIRYSFDEERAYHKVNLEHQPSLPLLQNYSNIIKQQSALQFTKVESNLKGILPEKGLPPLVRVKVIIQMFFNKMPSCQYVQIDHQEEDKMVLVAINNVRFDYDLGTPALDLAFCSTTRSTTEATIWESNFGSLLGFKTTLSSAQFECFKSTLMFFMKQTFGNLQNCRKIHPFSELFKLKMDHVFSRALVYLLLCDADKFFDKPVDKISPITMQPRLVAGAYCSRCRDVAFTHKRCTKCYKAFYCSKDCQRKHWTVHRNNCQRANPPPSRTSHQITGYFATQRSD